MPSNFGDFQIGIYLDAVKGINSRYPFDSQSIERKASEALPDWVYRYVSAAAGDGRTQRANIAAYSRYGITPRMMVSRPSVTCRSRCSTNILTPRSSCAPLA
jgi:lactate 2-monooxygenase